MEETKKINRLISIVLKVSSGISMFMMIAGFGLYLANPEQMSPGTKVMSFADALTGALQLKAMGLMTLGIIILISTPFLRVIGAIFSFLFFERDKVYGFISLGVLAVLLLGLFVPGLK